MKIPKMTPGQLAKARRLIRNAILPLDPVQFWKETFWADRAQSTVPAAMLCSAPEATVRNIAGSVRLRSDADRKQNTREKYAVLWNIRTSGARINTDFFQTDLMPDDNYILKPTKHGSNGLQHGLRRTL